MNIACIYIENLHKLCTFSYQKKTHNLYKTLNPHTVLQCLTAHALQPVHTRHGIIILTVYTSLFLWILYKSNSIIPVWRAAAWFPQWPCSWNSPAKPLLHHQPSSYCREEIACLSASFIFLVYKAGSRIKLQYKLWIIWHIQSKGTHTLQRGL